MDSDDDDDISLADFAKMLKAKDVAVLEEKAVEESKKRHCKQRKRERLHERNVDRMLHANGLKRISVPKNGDCIFSAISLHTDPLVEQHRLRQFVCSHLQQNENLFRHFFPGTSASFQEQLLQLNKPGQWLSDLADAVPLAIANIIQKDVVIFTSVQTVLCIHPNVVLKPTVRVLGKACFLAHLRVPRHEHYDGVALDGEQVCTVLHQDNLAIEE